VIGVKFVEVNFADVPPVIWYFGMEFKEILGFSFCCYVIFLSVDLSLG